MRFNIILISLVFITATAQAQDSKQNLITVQTSAEELVPADEISLRIMLNAEANTPQEAYELHKKREKVLVDLLKNHQIREKNIDFDPTSISKRYNSRPGDREQEKIVTRQQVLLKLDDFDTYETIQIALIENGFDEFSGSFTSTESDQAEDEALRKALRMAREKADVIADETGLRIEGIKDISYSYSGSPPRPMEMMEMRASSDSGGLMEFDQMVSITASVTVNYRVEN